MLMMVAGECLGTALTEQVKKLTRVARTARDIDMVFADTLVSRKAKIITWVGRQAGTSILFPVS